VRVGRPSAEFPWPWTITQWLDGELAAFDPNGALVDDLALFVRELHTPAPPDAPRNAVRGVPLAHRDEVVRARLASEPIPRRDDIVALWSKSVETTPWAGPPLWLHGDLHPANILASSGRLAGILDFGDLTAGDPATDLAVAFLLFDRDSRTRFRVALDYDEPTWQRAAGWAIIFASLAVGGDSTFLTFAADAFEQVLLD
jgi:aminoglycoside phosphotransferase (APT) family kinase protein